MTNPCCGREPKDCYCAAMQEKGRKVEKVKGNEPTDADREQARRWLEDQPQPQTGWPTREDWQTYIVGSLASLIAAVRAEYAPAVALLREAADPDPAKDNWLMNAIVKSLGEFQGGMLADMLTPDDAGDIGPGKAMVELLADGVWADVVEPIDAFLAAHGKGGA